MALGQCYPTTCCVLVRNNNNYESLLSMICVYELHAYQWPNLPLIAGEYGGTYIYASAVFEVF